VGWEGALRPGKFPAWWERVTGNFCTPVVEIPRAVEFESVECFKIPATYLIVTLMVL